MQNITGYIYRMTAIKFCGMPPEHRRRKAKTPAHRVEITIQQCDGIRVVFVMRDVVSLSTRFLEAPLETSDSIRVDASVTDGDPKGSAWQPLVDHACEDAIGEIAQRFSKENR